MRVVASLAGHGRAAPGRAEGWTFGKFVKIGKKSENPSRKEELGCTHSLTHTHSRWIRHARRQAGMHALAHSDTQPLLALTHSLTTSTNSRNTLHTWQTSQPCITQQLITHVHQAHHISLYIYIYSLMFLWEREYLKLPPKGSAGGLPHTHRYIFCRETERPQALWCRYHPHVLLLQPANQVYWTTEGRTISTNNLTTEPNRDSWMLVAHFINK